MSGERSDLLCVRIIDLLSMSELMLEELFMNVNFRIEVVDECREHVSIFREQFPLATLVLELGQLSSQGLVRTKPSYFPAEAGAAGVWYELTDRGVARAVEIARRSTPAEIYAVRLSGIVAAPPPGSLPHR